MTRTIDELVNLIIKETKEPPATLNHRPKNSSGGIGSRTVSHIHARNIELAIKNLILEWVSSKLTEIK